jgi:hypothetical protein
MGFGPIRTLSVLRSRTTSEAIKKATSSKLVPPGPRPGHEPHATIPPMIPRRPRPQSVFAFVLCLILIGCGTAGPTLSPTTSAPASASATPATPAGSPTTPPDPATVYAAIEEQVRALRGLQAKVPVDPKVLDEAALGKYIQDSFRRDNPPQLIKANERLLKGLGLLPPDASLEKLYIDLLSGAVAGLYNPKDKQLYVISKSGALGPSEKTTFAHEYTHALQDQNFGLAGMQLDAPGEGDRAIARLSLVEGDATLVMTYWQIDNLSQAEILQLFGESLDPKVTGVLTNTPPVLRDSLLFPYTSGLNFVQRLQGAGGWQAVDNAFSKPPASTEQILHPDKYDSGEAPKKVDLPDDLAARMGAGWSVGLVDTLGEFQLKLWLSEAGAADSKGAEAAAAGWGGDRTVIVDGPDGAFAIAVATEWDTPADASEFATKAREVVGGLANPGDVLAPVDGTKVTVVVVSGQQLIGRFENVLGLAG